MKKIAFIGSGTMGTALATAVCRTADPGEVMVTDSVREKAEALAQSLGCSAASSNSDAVVNSEYIVFCVKPQFLMDVLREVRPAFEMCAGRGEKKIIVTIVAGVERQTYLDALRLDSGKISVIRILPNTACLIGKGFILMEEGDTYTEQEVSELRELLHGAGRIDSLPAKQFTAGCVLTSTAPAFIAMFANSLADGGVYNGLRRAQARRYALEGIRGTVELLLQSDKHLEELKDDVCSPAGPAMYGVKTLEDRGFRSCVINAVVDAYTRFADIGKIQ
jgi:pyrroline-5-carboxylate reductase